MDQSRIIEIYRSTVRPLYATVSGWTRGERDRTEDVVQETWLRAVRAWSDQGVPDNPLAWLRTVARNLVVSESRRQRPETDNERALTRAAPGPELDRTERLALEEGLAALPNAQAGMLRAFHLEGDSMRDLAERLGISERAVEGRLRRARQALRRRLEPTDFPEETPS